MSAVLGTREDNGLEERANEVRWRFLQALDELQLRRTRMMDLRGQVQEHGLALAIAGGVFSLAIIGASFLLVRAAVRRQRRPLRTRMQAVFNVWRRPELLDRARGPGFPERLAMRLLVTLVNVGFGLLARRIESSRSPGRAARELELTP